MKDREDSGTKLWMIEMIIGLLFFSIASACCLQVFAAASVRSRQARQLKVAVNSTENLLQQLRFVKGETEDLAVFYPNSEMLLAGQLFFDPSGNDCAEDEQDYAMQFCVEKNGWAAEVEIVCRDKEGREIYALSTLLVVEETYEQKG